MKLVDVRQMKEIEAEANLRGTSYDQMMQNAGKGLAEFVNNAYSHISNRAVLGLVGNGNNGGDTLVAMTALQKLGWKTTAYLLKIRPDNDVIFTDYLNSGGIAQVLESEKVIKELLKSLQETYLILDGFLGTGFVLPLRADIANILMRINKELLIVPQKIFIVAVDCPSGLDCDSGKSAPECIRADVTVCMAAVKQGLLTPEVTEIVGEITVVDIGLKEDLSNWMNIDHFVADIPLIQSTFPHRASDSHKGTFGTAMIIGGSINYTGAIYLSGKSAYRSGAGLVTLGVPTPLQPLIAGQLPEATWLLLPNEMGAISENAIPVIVRNLEKVTALLIGPGLGLEETTRLFVTELIMHKPYNAYTHIGFLGVHDTESTSKTDIKIPPLVIDADGLKLIAKVGDWYLKIPTGSILTPHPGEMAILTGLKIAEIQKNRAGVALDHARKWGQVVVLKGAYTIIAEPKGKMVVIPIATPALARAGTGDVLAGMIVGLLAQGMNAFDAAVTGAWLHARAGLLALQEFGNAASIMASDIVDEIPEAINELN